MEADAPGSAERSRGDGQSPVDNHETKTFTSDTDGPGKLPFVQENPFGQLLVSDEQEKVSCFLRLF